MMLKCWYAFVLYMEVPMVSFCGQLRDWVVGKDELLENGSVGISVGEHVKGGLDITLYN